MDIYIYNMNILVNIYKCDRDILRNWLKFYALKKSLHTSSLCWFQPKVFAMPEAAMGFFFLVLVHRISSQDFQDISVTLFICILKFKYRERESADRV